MTNEYLVSEESVKNLIDEIRYDFEVTRRPLVCGEVVILSSFANYAIDCCYRLYGMLGSLQALNLGDYLEIESFRAEIFQTIEKLFEYR